MLLIDRYILGRFLANFVILFALLFIFAASLDMILALDEYVDAARGSGETVRSGLPMLAALVRSAVNFQSPRFFQFYGYLHGIVCVGAMGFTLAQMHRHRELVALLAAGVGLARVAMPFIVGTFLLSVLQLLNQELILPRVAPLLLRGHAEIGEQSVAQFPVHFTRDAQGALYHARAFDPRDSTLVGLTILERDDLGRTVRRIAAASAQWTEQGPDGAGWVLEGAVALALETGEGQPAAQRREAIFFYPSDLSPHALTVRRYGEFASMLSLRQISEMLATPGVADERMLKRYRYSRFAAVLINVAIMWMALPTFLLRQPANLLVQAIICSTLAIPALIGAAITMVVDMPGIPPAVSVFLPVLVLVPVVLAQWTYLKT